LVVEKFFFIMPLACTHCRAAKAKCDHGDPCSRCQELGLKCYTRKRKPYKKNRKNGKKRTAPSAATAAARPNKKTKTKGGGGGAASPLSPPGVSSVLELAKNKTDAFYSPEVDLTAFQMFSKLSPSHFAVPTAVKILMVLAYRKASMSLLHYTTSFATVFRLTTIFPSLGNLNKKHLREVKRGDCSDLPPHVLRAHDAAVGINDAASAAKNWGNDRIIISATKEFAPEGALFVASDEAWRLLNLDETEMRTTFQAHDEVIKAAFDTADYHKIAHSVLSMLVTYETRHDGPLTVCTENLTFLYPVAGHISGHMYSTLWMGTNGLDGVNIQEFVPLSKISSEASARVVQGTEEDFTAAEAIMALGHK